MEPLNQPQLSADHKTMMVTYGLVSEGINIIDLSDKTVRQSFGDYIDNSKLSPDGKLIACMELDCAIVRLSRRNWQTGRERIDRTPLCVLAPLPSWR